MILGYYAQNDFQPPSALTNIGVQRPGGGANGFFKSYLVNLADLALGPPLSPLPRRYPEYQIEYMRKQLRRLHELAAGVGARVLIDYLHLGCEDLHPIQRLAEDAGLNFVDAGALLRGKDPGLLPLAPTAACCLDEKAQE